MIYVFFCYTFLVLCYLFFYRDRSKFFYLSLLSIFFFLAILSIRDIKHPGDTRVYVYIFDLIYNSETLTQAVNTSEMEVGFVTLNYILSLFSLRDSSYILAISAIISLLWFTAIKKLSSTNLYHIAILGFVSLFASYNLGMNVLRQGIAMPLGLLGIYFLMYKDKLFHALVFFLLSLSFHFTAVIYLFCAIIVKANINHWLLLLSFCLVSLLSYMGLTEPILLYVLDLLGYSSYMSDAVEVRYNTGFRIDFWVFTVLPIAFIYLFRRGELYKFKDLRVLVSIYLIAGSLFVLAFDMPFSDRVGLYSWMLMPLFLGSEGGVLDINRRVIVLGCLCLGIASFIYKPMVV